MKREREKKWKIVDKNFLQLHGGCCPHWVGDSCTRTIAWRRDRADKVKLLIRDHRDYPLYTSTGMSRSRSCTTVLSVRAATVRQTLSGGRWFLFFTKNECSAIASVPVTLARRSRESRLKTDGPPCNYYSFTYLHRYINVLHNIAFFERFSVPVSAVDVIRKRTKRKVLLRDTNDYTYLQQGGNAVNVLFSLNRWRIATAKRVGNRVLFCVFRNFPKNRKLQK